MRCVKHIVLHNLFIETIVDTIKKEGLYNGLLHILLLRMAARVASQLGMPPGGEFRRAFEEVCVHIVKTILFVWFISLYA